MIELLKELEENTTTPDGDIWSVTLHSDGTGELIHPSETSLVVYHDKSDLLHYVNALIESEKTLTVSLCAEILSEVRL